MIDFLPSSTATINFYLEDDGAPVTGATVTCTVVSPSGTTLVNAAAATEVGGGYYSYTLTYTQTADIGTYFVTWHVSAPSEYTQKTTFTVGYESAYNLTILDVRHMMARQVEGVEAFYLGEVTHIDTVEKSSHSGTTLYDVSRLEPDAALVGSHLYVYSGTGKGSGGRVTEYSVNDSREATVPGHPWLPTKLVVAPALSPRPQEADRYEIHREFRKEDFDSAIRLAYFDVSKYTLVPILYSGLTVDSNTAEYDIPAGFSHIHKVEVRVDDLNWQPVAAGLWSVVRTQRKLRLHPRIFYNYSGRPMRLYGLRPPSDPLTDDVGVDVDPNYLVNKASAYLVFGKIKQPGDAWSAKYQMFESKAQMAKLELNKSIPNNTRRVE